MHIKLGRTAAMISNFCSFLFFPSLLKMHSTISKIWKLLFFASYLLALFCLNDSCWVSLYIHRNNICESLWSKDGSFKGCHYRTFWYSISWWSFCLWLFLPSKISKWATGMFGVHVSVCFPKIPILEYYKVYKLILTMFNGYMEFLIRWFITILVASG